MSCAAVLGGTTGAKEDAWGVELTPTRGLVVVMGDGCARAAGLAGG
jgi:hypothetical protein